MNPIPYPTFISYLTRRHRGGNWQAVSGSSPTGRQAATRSCSTQEARYAADTAAQQLLLLLCQQVAVSSVLTLSSTWATGESTTATRKALKR